MMRTALIAGGGGNGGSGSGGDAGNGRSGDAAGGASGQAGRGSGQQDHRFGAGDEECEHGERGGDFLCGLAVGRGQALRGAFAIARHSRC